METKDQYQTWKKIKNPKYLCSDDLIIGLNEQRYPVYGEINLEILEVKKEETHDATGRLSSVAAAYFKEDIKPMILNATNAKIIQGFAKNNPVISEWKNIRITVYVGDKRVKKETVKGLSVKTTQPIPKQQVTDVMIEKYVELIKKGEREKQAVIANFKETTLITKEQIEKLQNA